MSKAFKITVLIVSAGIIIFMLILYIHMLSIHKHVNLQKETRTPKKIFINMFSDEYQSILNPSDTINMESGFVTLKPGESVGKHTTNNREEVVIVFSGIGKMELTKWPTIDLYPWYVIYCPPYTEHNVVNTGKEPLKYLYVVSKAEVR